MEEERRLDARGEGREGGGDEGRGGQRNVESNEFSWDVFRFRTILQVNLTWRYWNSRCRHVIHCMY